MSIGTHTLSYKLQISYMYTNGAQEIKKKQTETKQNCLLLLKFQR